MSNKIEETCKTLDQCSNGYSVDNIQNPSLIHDNQRIFQNEFPSKFILDNYKTIIEVKVKEKRHKPAQAMVSSTSNREQNTKEGQRSNGEHPQNWLQDLQEHTRPYLKKNLQNLSLKNQHTKKISSSEPKDNKKLSTPQQKIKCRSNSANKQLDEVPVKQVPLQKISKEHVKQSQQTGFSSGVSTKCIKCTKSVLVIDREVQCGGIFDSSYDKYNSFNPVRTLGFLMRELEYLIKDEISSEILTEMEQTLIRIPVELKKSTTTDLDVLTPRTRLNERTVKIEKMSKQVNTICGSLREERDSLKRNVEKYSKLLEEARRKQSDSESTISKLKEQVNEALKTIESKDELISELQEKIKKMEPLEKELTELRIDLTKQTELIRQNRLENQYLMLENDKLLVMSSHKDSQFNEYHCDVMKEFQNEIGHLIDVFREAGIREVNSNLQNSGIQCGLACSSPSASSSDRSNIPTSWHNLVDMSISTIEDNKNLKKATSKKDKLLTPSYRIKEKDTAKTTMEEITQLEFISLPPAESILFPSYRDQECLDESGINKDKDYLFPSKSKLSDRIQQFVDADSTKSSVQCINEKDNEKDNENESYKKHLSKTRKTLKFDNKKKNHDNESIEESSKFIETNVSGDILNSNINKQFETIFNEVRHKSRISVSVPSPPRHYPHPDWTDSSLPSVSVDSELNIVQSNIT
ncbi:PREDICTED: uncharacterized protein LOC106791555 [Polistes canadensis]|uniref:uncharacterized protein LOC106791555 n=1 Tax=Polistes canadensis TaxID=91411 RepID=UPI000718E4EA|nr:PREDICTED: uncharacterized protein LOC106791555 [Polistes canadensis]